MTERKQIYTGLTCIAWGLFLQYFNLNLGQINVLPAFAGWFLQLRGCRLLEGEARDLALLRPFGRIGFLWSLFLWGAACLGLEPGWKSQPLFAALSLVIGILDLYFHFQLFTDLADLAERAQPEGDIQNRLLRWRTGQTVTLTAVLLLTAPPFQRPEWWEHLTNCAAVVCLFAIFWSMMATFALRKLFFGETGIEEKMEM